MANGLIYSMLTIQRETEDSQCQCNSCTGKADDDYTDDKADGKLKGKIVKRLALPYCLNQCEVFEGKTKSDQPKKKKSKNTRIKERLQALEEEITSLRLGTFVSDDNTESEWTTDDDLEDDEDNNSDLCNWHYKSTGAYNYEKREESVVVMTTKEEAAKNAQQLIESEEMAKKKAERKKAKKKRQKEKKKSEKTEENSRERKSTLNSATSLESVSSNQPVKSKEQPVQIKKDAVEASDKDEPITDEDDFLDGNAAFVKVAVKQNNKSNTRKIVIDPPEKSPATKKVRCVKAVETKSFESPDRLGMQGYQFALSNNLIEAIKCLSQAINANPTDIRHYVNRSYCYLRLGQYTSALNDAQVVMRNTRPGREAARAACRAGQAYFGMQDYTNAEKYFEESISMSRGNIWVYRELIRVRVAQLTNMGFVEKDALRALQQCTTVTDAVTLLTSQQINTNGNSVEDSYSGSEGGDGDDIYCSDDDGTPSNTKELTKLISNFQYFPISAKAIHTQNLAPTSYLNGYGNWSSNIAFNNLRKDVPNQNASTSIILNNHYNQPTNNISGNGNGMLSTGAIKKVPVNNGNAKTIVANFKQQPDKAVVNEKAIWIGNVTDKITDDRLHQEFSKFGQIVGSIHRLSSKYCVFINYTSSIAASQAITTMNGFEINGIKLMVRTAQKANDKPKQ